MLRFHVLHPVLLLIVLLCSAPRCTAQPGEDRGTLYFPPMLAINYQFGNGEPVLGIMESITPTTTTLLPILFFDHPGDWAIPPRYQMFTGSYDARDYADTNTVWDWNPMGKYYELLNIIGFRMQEYPGTSIYLRGGYSTEPGENAEIADARSQVVREYLLNVWHIPSERIKLLPSRRMCDSADHFFRQQEARQVMIASNNWELLEPVNYSITTRSIGSLYMLFTIDPRTPPEDVEEITIVMAADDKIIGQATIPGAPDSTIYQMRGMWWKTGSAPNEDVDFSSISVEAHVRLHDGNMRRSNTEKIGVQVNRYEYQASSLQGMPNTLTLPFFSYKDSTLNGYHRLLIEQFMLGRPTDQPIAMDLIGKADLSEDPEVDAATLAQYVSNENTYNPYSSYSAGTAQTGEIGQLHLWPGSTQTTAETAQQTETAQIVDTQEYTYTTDSAEAETEENLFTSDSLAMARTRVVERYFRDSLKLNISTFDQLPDRNRSVATTFEYLPEERWLARSVVLVLYSYERFTQQQNRLLKAMEEQEEN